MTIDRVPAGAGIRVVGRTEGTPFAVAGTCFTWKARGEDTGFAFSFYEQALAPGDGVPLHVHPYAEAFYVLDGAVDFLTDAVADGWMRCTAGETAIVSANTRHAFYNRTDAPARLLSISTQLHQAFFDAAQAADAAGALSELAPPDAMAAIGPIAARFDMHFDPDFKPPVIKESAA